VEDVCRSITRNLGFQADSVMNQVEHIFELWESFYRRQTASGLPGAQRAITALRDELLRTQMKWHDQVWLPLLETLRPRDARQSGARHSLLDKASQHDFPLRDVCLFLLIWGELGNLRFCPELLCFLFSSARAALHWDAAGNAMCIDGEDVSEGTFLNSVVKPMYEAIASETFNLQRHGPPKFKWPGAPAPAMAANYDDWNELFWDPHRLAGAIVFKPQSRLATAGRRATLARAREVQAADIWGLLPDVDWIQTFTKQKSHKELHSLLPFMVGSYRIFMVQAMFLMVLLLSWAKEPRLGSWVQRSAVGVIPPAFLWFHLLGFHMLTPGIPFLLRVRDFLRLIFVHSLPMLTFAMIAVHEYYEEFVPSLGIVLAGKQPLWLLAVHFSLSVFVLMAAVAPRPQNVYQWRFYPQQSERDTWALVGFWAVTAGCKLLFDWSIASAVDDSVLSLWTLEWGDTFEQPDPERRKIPLLIVHHIVLAVPVGLASFASLAFFNNFFIGIVGATRGVGIFGGARLCCTLRGRGMIPVPERTAKYVLQVAPDQGHQSRSPWSVEFWYSRMSDTELGAFIKVWDKMVQDLREHDLVSQVEMDGLTIGSVEAARHGRSNIPRILDPMSTVNILREVLPINKEARRRIITFARCVQMRGLPSGKVQTMPTLTVLIPHYSEQILYTRDELFPNNTSSEVLRFLIKYYADEFRNFVERECAHIPLVAGSAEVQTQSFTGPRSAGLVELEKNLCEWASLRMQTLHRTVKGICSAYDDALKSLASLQEGLSDERCGELVQERLQVIVAMQEYSKFTDSTCAKYDIHKTAAAEALLQTFPRILNIACIEEVQSEEGSRFYTCLIDASCERVSSGPSGLPTGRKPRLRVELPGAPILGHGKSDNQNCAIIFSRGEIMQMIDCNQDAYFESALFLPLAVHEFNVTNKDGLRPAILGFREHIFSDIGLLGKWAADNEFAFGTVVQRTMDSPLKARLHYGHPDMMDKLQMIQQGGVSKGTRGLNLSEDVFAGLDLTLRGGWSQYREYFHVGKGRDMGFMSILSFFGKVSQGNGEQATTRQWMRLGLELPLLRYASIFYLHTGWYFNQVLVNRAMKGAAFMAAFFTLSGSVSPRFGKVGFHLISHYFGIYYLFYMLATMIPLTSEVFIEKGCIAAFKSFWSSLIHLNPVFAAFQSKLMDYHFITTLTHGGAQYIPTGRGLATSRESFLTIFRSFAVSHMDDALEIALFLIFSNGYSYGLIFNLCAGLTVTSWIVCPFLFNPWQFDTRTAVFKDLQAWRKWLHSDEPKAEQAWWAWAAGAQDMKRSRSRRWVVVPSIRLLTVACTGVLVGTLMPFPALPANGSFSEVMAWLRAVLVFLPPLLHVVPCTIFAGVYRKDSGKSLYAYLAVVAVIISLVELAFMDHPQLTWRTLKCVLFHKYIALRLVLEVADDWSAHQYGGRCFSWFHHTARMWSLSWRFIRDSFLGYLLILTWIVLSLIIPHWCHTAFLFSTRRLASENADRVRSNTESASNASVLNPDDLVRRFFHHFAPQDAAELVNLLFDRGVSAPSQVEVAGDEDLQGSPLSAPLSRQTFEISASPRTSLLADIEPQHIWRHSTESFHVQVSEVDEHLAEEVKQQEPEREDHAASTATTVQQPDEEAPAAAPAATAAAEGEAPAAADEAAPAVTADAPAAPPAAAAAAAEGEAPEAPPAAAAADEGEAAPEAAAAEDEALATAAAAAAAGGSAAAHGDD